MRQALWSLLFAAAALPGCAANDGAEPELPPDGENEIFVLADDQKGKTDANGIEEHSYEGICVLQLVNTATGDELRKAGVYRWPAEGIEAHRAGPDGRLGTSDDNVFDTLTELDGVSWVGWQTFRALKKHARANGYCPQIGEERIMPGEAEAIDKVREGGERFIRKTYADNPPARRDAHAKAHGCVKAFFEVDNRALDIDEQVGIFAENTKYPAWIRFSNGNFHVADDGERDVRGMAVKLMGVKGEKVLEDQRDEQTQDFLLINGPSMFARNAVEYVELTTKGFEGNPVSYFLSLDPREWRLRELVNLGRIFLKGMSNPLDSRFWSTTPYRLGADGAMKYSARPCAGERLGKPSRPAANYLRDALAERLTESEGCFEFMIQRQTDAEKMPIEDPTIEWGEKTSPFLVVGRITIPPQSFNSPEQREFCDNLSFTPWHTLPEHRPLGGVNRVRRSVYQAISFLRHDINGVKRLEPRSHEITDLLDRQ